MITFALVFLFLASALVASAWSYDVTRWRYAALANFLCGAVLTYRCATMMRQVFPSAVPLLVVGLVAAVPFAFVFWRLVARRRSIPLHTPGLNDDPWLRRYLEEKRRRVRLRRQEEEALDNAELSSLEPDEKPEPPLR